MTPTAKRILIVAFDALRPDMITPELMPNLTAFAALGFRVLEHYPILRCHLTGLFCPVVRSASKCDVGHRMRSATRPRDKRTRPSAKFELGSQGGSSAALRRLPAIWDSGSHIAPRAAPNRMSRSGPSNDPVRSDNALTQTFRNLSAVPKKRLARAAAAAGSPVVRNRVAARGAGATSNSPWRAK